MQEEDIIKEIINIDNIAKSNLKDVVEKKKNFDKYAKEEICIKEGALYAKYRDNLEKIKQEYDVKLQKEKTMIERDTSKIIEDMKYDYNLTKDEHIINLFETILKKVKGI